MDSNIMSASHLVRLMCKAKTVIPHIPYPYSELQNIIFFTQTTFKENFIYLQKGVIYGNDKLCKMQHKCQNKIKLTKNDQNDL